MTKSITLTLALLLSVFWLAGCRLIWTDDLFAVGLFTDLKAEDGSLVSEPNRLEINASRVDSETDNVRIITPSVIIESKGK